MQRAQLQQFLYECTVEALVKDVLEDTVNIHNLRQKIAKLHIEGKELAQYGRSKHPEKQGIDTYAEENVEKGEFYKMDPTGRRTGNGESAAF
jgi:cilia- and flagella-associated protein 298